MEAATKAHVWASGAKQVDTTTPDFAHKRMGSGGLPCRRLSLGDGRATPADPRSPLRHGQVATTVPDSPGFVDWWIPPFWAAPPVSWTGRYHRSGLRPHVRLVDTTVLDWWIPPFWASGPEGTTVPASRPATPFWHQPARSHWALAATTKLQITHRCRLSECSPGLTRFTTRHHTYFYPIGDATAQIPPFVRCAHI